MKSLVISKPPAPLLESCELAFVPNWIRRVLVIDPPNGQQLIKELLSYGCLITVVSTAASRLSKDAVEELFDPSRVHFVYADPAAFLAACDLQLFFGIFIDAGVLHKYPSLITVARRAMAWNGRLYCFNSESLPASNMLVQRLPAGVLYAEKSVGWLLCSFPRCGTHMLLSALSQHTDLSVAGELFNHEAAAGSHGFRTVQQALEVGWSSASAGFAVHSSIDREPHVAGMTDTMSGCEGFWSIVPDYCRAILLTRENLLHRHVSHQLAMATGIWNSQDSNSSGTSYSPVQVDLVNLEREISYVQRCQDAAAVYFKYSLVITYEQMCRDFDNVMLRVFDFLGVLPQSVKPTTVKVSAPVDELIQNPQPVAAWCRRKGFSNFLQV